MEKEFVPYELALRLKALGFVESCWCYFVNNVFYDSMFPKDYEYFEGMSKKYSTYTLAPTFSQAFRWFREKYHLYGKVETTSLTCHFIMIKEVTLDGTIRENPKYVTYNSYEEAELDCLKQLIEIVESKIK